LERLTVNTDLGVETIECVLRAFDFVPVQSAINDSDIDAASGMRKPKLIDHQGIWMRLESAQLRRMKRHTDI
jgi:hypothetical protein